ncbi:MAG: hypothetical protein O7D86_10245 [Proteobacteria bacterium]|nr:hypothetical protein [Pseudomonadota bacterium]
MRRIFSIDDPARELGSEVKQDHEFLRVFMELEQRIQNFTNLPIKKMDKMTLLEQMNYPAAS